jgi:hypothetical protein
MILTKFYVEFAKSFSACKKRQNTKNYDVKAATGGVERGDVRRQLWTIPSSAGQAGAPQIPHQVKIAFLNVL